MALVLLHPLPLDGSIWESDIGSLASRVIRPTLYDLGNSIEEWASAVLDMVGGEPMTIAGNSIGGSCAIELARLAAPQVELMVLVGTKPGHRREPDLRDEALRVLSAEGVAGAWDRYWAPLFGPETDSEIIDRARNVALSLSVDAVMRGVRVFHARPDRSEFLASLDVPVVVVTGEYDTAPGVDACRRISSALCQGEFKLIAGAGHYVPIERSAEFATLVRGVMATSGRIS